MFNFKRGDVYLVEEHDARGSEQKKTRPWIIVGANPINKGRSTVLAIPMSTSAKECPPISIKVYINNALNCVVIDQLRALDKKRFLHFEGSLLQHEMDLIDENLRKVLSL